MFWSSAFIFWFTGKVNDVYEADGWCTVLKDAVTRRAETRDADSKVNLYLQLCLFGFAPNNGEMNFKKPFFLGGRTKAFKNAFTLPFFSIDKYFFPVRNIKFPDALICAVQSYFCNWLCRKQILFLRPCYGLVWKNSWMVLVTQTC